MTGMDNQLKTMILDYLEKGFLDNIIDMFKHDKSLYPLIIDMIKDERMRVRLGAIALVEELTKISKEQFTEILPAVSELLKDPNPLIRGDAAYLLEIIGLEAALPFLLEAYNDKDQNVREIVLNSAQHIKSLMLERQYKH